LLARISPPGIVALVVGKPTVAAARELDELAPSISCVSVEAADERTLANAECAFIWDFRPHVLEGWWPKLRDIRWVQAASAGVDHLLFQSLRDSAVVVTNSAGVFEGAISEYAIGLILMSAKGFAVTIAAQQAHRWCYREVEGVAGKRLLVVGFGRIGRAVADLARSFGMRVSAVRRTSDSVPGVDRVFTPDALASALAEADYVVVSVALTDETRGLIGARELAAMPPNAYLINVARGDVVDTVALCQALVAGSIAGAALDAFTDEPLAASSRLWDIPNLFVSPHMSGDVRGWDTKVVAIFRDNAQRFRAGELLINTIDKQRGY
jgi:phosphoglycerate dehydrogenase-like enzyme